MLKVGEAESRTAILDKGKVLVEGLKRAGQQLSRDKLIATLEHMYEYETGLTPRLTYGPNRHIGALGAHIVALDLATQQFVAGSAWIAPEECRSMGGEGKKVGKGGVAL
jgi:hypothetical protein